MRVVVALLLLACPVATVHAQSVPAPETQITRASIAAEQRARRAVESGTGQGRVERAFLHLSDDRVLERVFNPRRGWFIRFGLPTEGASPAAGPAWRAGNPEHTYIFTASAAVSISREWLGEVALQLPDLFPATGANRIFGAVSVSRSGRVENEFWGLGPATGDAVRARYRMAQTFTSGSIGVRLAPWFTVTGGTGWLDPHLDNAGRAEQPIDEAFNETLAPGLVAQPSFLRTEAAADLDYRESLPPSRTARRFDQVPLSGASRGGRYRMSVAYYSDREVHRYSFRQTTVDLQQHFAFVKGARGVSLRALAIMSDPHDDNAVPFYLSPTYGGVSVGRGWPTFRFRDRNLLALQAEYRYQVNPLVHAALFADSGQVARTVDAFTWPQFRTTYGFGVRFGAAGGAALRLDMAFGGDAPTFIFGMGHAF